MAVLLSLETSTTVCSAALHENGKLLAFSELHIAQSASSKLALMIDDLFRLCSVKPGQIDGVAVSGGPVHLQGCELGRNGQRNRLRLNIPFISVNTLELMAYQVASVDSPDSLLCPMLDARRMEVYYLLADRDLTILESTDAKVIDEFSFRNWLDKGPISFFGNGSPNAKRSFIIRMRGTLKTSARVLPHWGTGFQKNLNQIKLKTFLRTSRSISKILL